MTYKKTPTKKGFQLNHVSYKKKSTVTKGTYTPVYNRDLETGQILPPKSKNDEKIVKLDKNGKKKGEIERLEGSFYDDVVRKGPKDCPISIPDATGQQGPAMILRKKDPPNMEKPIRKYGNFIQKDITGNIIVDKQILVSFINDCMREHTENVPDCPNFVIDFHYFWKKGYSWMACIICQSCDYISKRRPLYKEISSTKKRGPKTAQLNLQMALGIQETCIGSERATLMMSYAGISTPSHASSQNNANKASDLATKLNKKDMGEKVDYLKQVMEARGFSADTPMSFQFDAQYNGAMGRARHTPGNASHSAQGLFLESVTDKHYIVECQVDSKYCSGHSVKGQSQTPGVGHKKCINDKQHRSDKCTATMPSGDIFNEGDMARKMAQRLKDNNKIKISHLATDSDGRAIDAVREVMDCDVQWQKDLSHTSKNQISAFRNVTFSKGFYGSQFTGPQIDKCSQAAANDIASRTAVLHRALNLKCNADLSKMKAAAEDIKLGLLRCYAGDHKRCKYTPYIKDTCNGPSGKTWQVKSAYLSAQGITNFFMTSSDREYLGRVIDMKLGADALDKTYQRATTQAAESTNNSIRVGVPKNRLFKRNLQGRVNSGIHRRNEGPEKSALAKLEEAKCSLPDGSPAMLRIRAQQRRLEYSRSYRKRPSVIKRMLQQRAQLKKEHFHAAKKRHNTVNYLSGLLEEERLVHSKVLERHGVEPTPSTSNAEHASVRRSRRRVRKAEKALEHAQHEVMEKKKQPKPTVKKRTSIKQKPKICPPPNTDHEYWC